MYPVMFVSLGPGESDLITLKGLKALQSADLIFYPSTQSRGQGSQSSRALDILSELGIDLGKTQAFDVPMNKDRSLAIAAYDRACEKVEEKQFSGHKVVVVAEGDISFYSSVHYILDKLVSENIQVESIAGIPAFIACASLAKLHIVKQEEELCVVPGIILKDELKQKIEEGKTVVIMKVSQCEEAVKTCIEQLPDIDYHYFENVGVVEKEFYTQSASDIQSRKFPYFSLMIIRK